MYFFKEKTIFFRRVFFFIKKRNFSGKKLEENKISSKTESKIILDNFPTIKISKEISWNYYICGFVEGEGSFTVSFRLLGKLKTGVEVRPSFSLARKKSNKNYNLLKKIRDTFGVGAIRDDGKGCYKYETRSLPDLLLKIIPFFKTYSLQGEKSFSFDIFSEICSRMERKLHLTEQGLKDILSLSETLNPFGSKRFCRVKLKSLISKINA